MRQHQRTKKSHTNDRGHHRKNHGTFAKHNNLPRRQIEPTIAEFAEELEIDPEDDALLRHVFDDDVEWEFAPRSVCWGESIA